MHWKLSKTACGDLAFNKVIQRRIFPEISLTGLKIGRSVLKLEKFVCDKNFYWKVRNLREENFRWRWTFWRIFFFVLTFSTWSKTRSNWIDWSQCLSLKKLQSTSKILVILNWLWWFDLRLVTIFQVMIKPMPMFVT